MICLYLLVCLLNIDSEINMFKPNLILVYTVCSGLSATILSIYGRHVANNSPTTDSNAQKQSDKIVYTNYLETDLGL